MRPRLRFIGLVTAACALLVSSAGAQQVTGRVMDDRTGQPIAAVQVFIADTGIGALTQQNGRYLLLNVPAGTHTLSVQRIGFGTQTQEITVAAGETVVLDFQLREQALAMDEIVITGVPGGNRRRAVGNVVSTLDAAALQEIVPIDKVGNILAGRTAGVNMTSVDGQVGSGSMIRVRGESTLSLPPNPLIYIDGVRVENAETTGPNESRISRLDDISPEEIESIEVLRGPSAATLYGTEASQGVVNIITKRGIAGAPQVNVSVRQGISTYIRPENIFPTNYWTHPDGTVIPFNMITDSPEGPTAFRDGHLSTYTASVSGGSEDLTYYLMGSYTDDEGQLKNNSNERFNTRLNLDMRPAEDLSISAGLSFVKNDIQQATRYGVVRGLVHAHAGNLEANRCLTQARPQCGYYRGWSNWGGPPEATESVDYDQHVMRSIGTFTVAHTPVSWLNNRVNIGYDVTDEQNLQLREYQTVDTIAFFLGSGFDGFRNNQRIQRYSTTFDAASTIDLGLTEGIGSTTSLGLQYYLKKTETLRARGEDFPGPGLLTIEATGTQTVSFDTFEENATLGFYVQEVLSFGDRLFLTGAVRVDNNSAFGDEIKWITYPKASLSYVMHEEPWFQNSAPSFVDALRLRAAWGQSGVQPPSFVALKTFGFVPGPVGKSGVSPSTLGNPDLRPEIGDEIEFGFDADFMDQRLGLVFTWYRKNTKDAILLRPNAPSGGFPGSRYVNAGLIANRGLEAELDADLFSGPGFGLNLGLRYSWNDSEIKQLSGEVGDTAIVWNFQNSMEHRVGYPPHSFFGPVVVSADWDPAARGGVGQGINPMCEDGRGGTMACFDAKGSVQAPRLYNGRAVAPHNVGISSVLRFGSSIRVSALMDIQMGHTRYDNTTRIRCYLFTMCKETHDPTPEDAIINSQVTQGDRLQYYTRADASFGRLREVSLNYTLPSNLVDGWGLSRASIIIAARNLWTITDWTGLDPESGGNQNVSRQWQEQHHVPSGSTFETTLRVGF